MDTSFAYLFFPVSFCVLSGILDYFAMASIGCAKRGLSLISVCPLFISGLITVTWSWIAFPLPVFYLLIYLSRISGALKRKRRTKQAFFYLNLGFINMMALHMVSIGIMALVAGQSMRALLESPCCCAVSISISLAVSAVESLILLRFPAAPAAIASISHSEEGRLFLAYLWFSTVYLLLDSLLCAGEAEAFFTPLFLIGSSAIVMLLLILFLWNIYTIVQSNHIKDEHVRLQSELAQREQTADALRLISDRDALTGAYSRRRGMALLAEWTQRADPFSAVYLDLDHLKQINDREGHAAGDRYLAEFVKAVRLRLRDNDCLARMGGDEFMILLPCCCALAAHKRISEIREEIVVCRDGLRRFDFSFGIVEYHPGDGTTISALIRQADQAMYLDKRRSRDKRGGMQE